MAGYDRDNRGNRDSRFDKGSSFKRGGFNDRGSNQGSDRPEMHQATCDKCGKSCEVPFRPTSGKPVFCRDCYVRPESSDSRRDGGQRSFDRPRFEERNERQTTPPVNNNQSNQFEALNAKLDKIIKLLTPIAQEVATVEAEQAGIEAAPIKKARKPKKTANPE